MIIAVDLDGMFYAFPNFFKELFQAFQDKGNKVGILSARPESEKEQISNALEEFGVHPDFCILKPDDLEVSNGIYKALVCNDLGVNLLFDDFQSSDPSMLSDFFCTVDNTKVVPFTSWAYEPEG